MGIDALASIGIGMNPNLINAGGFLLSWHGVFTFIAVAVAVFLVVRWGTREGMVADVLYSASMWAIIGGIIGARLLHVIDFWDEVYQQDFIVFSEFGREESLSSELSPEASWAAPSTS